MRQICLLVILAQIGSRLPCHSFKWTLVDRIFTRLGAHDSILSGNSTFMNELSETGRMLRGASSRSLVVVDELGRGTSTHDGIALAWAVLRHCAHVVECVGFFSTHYHQLTRDVRADAALSRLVRCQHMAAAVDSAQQTVTFLYKLVDGVCDDSQGMAVARMAHVPADVVEHARRVSADVAVVARFLQLATQLDE